MPEALNLMALSSWTVAGEHCCQ